MRTLVIDTATKACSVALYDDNSVVASFHEVIGRGHAERLLPLIAALPDRGRAERVMVDTGPGSFTGIRVGVAAARALGFAWSVPVAGFGCLTLVAAMAQAQMQARAAVDVVMTGGHGEYFFEGFTADLISKAPAVSLNLEQVTSTSQAPYIVGDVVLPPADKKHAHFLPEAAKWHLIAGLTSLPTSPVYGRPPDAKPQNSVAE